MFFELIRVREKGWVLPRHRLATMPRLRGLLSVDEQLDQSLNRTVRVAVFIDTRTKRPIAEVLPLFDVTLLRATPEYISLSGFERIHDMLAQRDYDYAQSWVLYSTEDEFSAGLLSGP